MKKRGFLLLIVIAVLWWWNFYRGKKFYKKNKEVIPQVALKQVDIKKIEEKENLMDRKLIEKAKKSFENEFHRKPKNLTELVEKGFLSEKFLKNLPNPFK